MKTKSMIEMREEALKDSFNILRIPETPESRKVVEKSLLYQFRLCRISILNLGAAFGKVNWDKVYNRENNTKI